MKWTLRLNSFVECDIREIGCWYEQRNPGRRIRFEEALGEALTRITTNPEAFAPVIRQFRRARVKGYPYGVYFELRDDVIYVNAILHAKQGFEKLFWRTE